MTPRRRISARERMEIFKLHEGCCWLCKGKITGGWELDHIVARAFMPSDEAADAKENLAPAHVGCHRDKTTDDVNRIAKAKRMEQRTAGIRRQAKRPFRWWRRFNGEIVRKE